MFIEVTLPHGIAYLRADRIESVMPIAQDPDLGRIDDETQRTIITLIGSNESDWWVSEDAETIMERIHAEIRDMCQLTFQGVNSRTIKRMENQIVTLLNRTSGNVPRDGG